MGHGIDRSDRLLGINWPGDGVVTAPEGDLGVCVIHTHSDIRRPCLSFLHGALRKTPVPRVKRCHLDEIWSALGESTGRGKEPIRMGLMEQGLGLSRCDTDLNGDITRVSDSSIREACAGMGLASAALGWLLA